MKIERIWAMPNRNTFSIKPIRELILRNLYGYSIDPFANSNKLATVTNDIDLSYDTDYHMDAIDFLKSFGWNSGGMGKIQGFSIQEILLVPHGGWHNDTIVTVEVMNKSED